jgi:flavin-dependent dehydrogenase
MKLAKEKGIDLEIHLFDPKHFDQVGHAGCNLCAGLITSSVVQKLIDEGINLQEGILQRPVRGFLLSTAGGEERFYALKGQRLYSVFRGGGPHGSVVKPAGSFDLILAKKAVSQGAAFHPTRVTSVARKHGPNGSLWLLGTVDRDAYEMDFVVGAFGVNSNAGLLIEQIGFGYKRPAIETAFQAEFELDEEFIDRVYRNMVVLFDFGLKQVRLAALIPKRKFVTLTMLGDSPGWPALTWFLRQPKVSQFIPHASATHGSACACKPVMTISKAKNPVTDGLLMVGDAHVSRYYKNGIGSAFITAEHAARAILAGVDARTLRKHYVAPCRKRFYQDNRIGKVLFKMNDIIVRSPFHASTHLECATKGSTTGGKILNRAIWGLFTGETPYKRIALSFLHPMVLLTLAAEYGRRLVSGSAAVQHSSLGPLEPGAKVAIIGGGIGGSCTALALLREAERRNVTIKVFLMEPKIFGTQYNQCLGVLTPPLLEILEQELGIEVPEAMFRRVVTGYRLWSEEGAVELEDDDSRGKTVTIRRVELDRLLLERAEQRGVIHIQSRVTGIEIHPEEVILFTDSGTYSAEVVIGAFSLDETMQKGFEKEVGYTPPKAMESAVIKLHPADRTVIERFKGKIETFLAPVPGAAFAAIVPKGDHLSLVVAGRNVTTRHLLAFMELPVVKEILNFEYKFGSPFKGAFPNRPARRFFGNRYVMVGDATGLVRPFKGKGINSAAITGIRVAETIMKDGISREAFRKYAARCRGLTGNILFGKLAQWLSLFVGHTFGIVPLVEFARSNEEFRRALHGAVSGTVDYRDVLLTCVRPDIAFGITRSYAQRAVRRVIARFRGGKHE